MRALVAVLIGMVLGMGMLIPLIFFTQKPGASSLALSKAHDYSAPSVPPSIRSTRHAPLARRASPPPPSTALRPSADESPRTERRDSKGPVCPPCDMLFSKLRVTSAGDRMQHVEVQERGEPKSGTSFMFEWGGNLLIHACAYLKEHFGNNSCEVEFQNNRRWHTLEECTLKFDPRRAGPNAPCACHGVDRVYISIGKVLKHSLPVRNTCTWQHDDRIATGVPCVFRDGIAPRNYKELWMCVDEKRCGLNDKRQQMAIFRDPRPVTVSAYYHLQVHASSPQRPKVSVDDYFTKTLPHICQWVALRYILFEGYAEGSSTSFWYEEALTDPLAWHQQWLGFVGLHLPSPVVEGAKNAAMAGNFSFDSKFPGDKHPGGGSVIEDRSYRDELQPETLQGADDVMRTWLPPALLAKLGIRAN